MNVSGRKGNAGESRETRVREATPDDAAASIALFERLYAETSFLLWEPGEAHVTVEEQARRIAQTAENDAGVTFCCEAGGELIGVAFGSRGAAKRRRHALHLVIGVVQAWTGKGVGRRLMEALEAWARSRDVHRLELTVNVRNHRALALYEKLGFEREGVKRHSMRIEGEYVDELYMSKLLA